MKVLVTNYSSSSQTVLKAVLIKLGHQVETVSDGTAALASLRRSDGPKLAILDSRLPSLDGFEVCRRLRADPSDWGVFTLLMTRENDSAEPLLAFDAGADDFLQKPFNSGVATARLRLVESRVNKRQQRKSGTMGGEAGAATPSGRQKESQTLFSEKHPSLNALAPFANLDDLLVKVLGEMGLGKVTPVYDESIKIAPDFTIFSVIVLPEKGAWLDMVLEMDGSSAQALYNTMAGAEGSIEDLADMANETLNIAQGAIKTALQDAFVDVLTPVIPFLVPEEKKDLLSFTDGDSASRLFSMPEIMLRVRFCPHLSPVVTKHLDDVAMCDVVVEPITMPGSANLVFLNKGTMMNVSLLQKLREMGGSGMVKMRFSMIVPPTISQQLVRK